MGLLELVAVDGAAYDLRAALDAAQLPTDDLREPGRQFFRITRAGETVGFGGFERHDADILLRSIVVLPEHRGTGAGCAITSLLLKRAAVDGAQRAYLLTESAGPFFERAGFEVTDRSSAPALILATRQATSLCPSSAALLVRPILGEARD